MGKKQYLLLLIGIALICAVTLGFSYAYWNNIKLQDSSNVAGSKCFSIDFKEKEGSNINLNGAFPISDEEGMKSVPYEFTITNTCDMYARFNINLEILPTTTLSHDLIKVVINNNTPNVVNKYTSITATIDGATAYTLLSGGLAKGQSETFNFRMWVDSSATLENSQNKTIATKIVVTASASEEPNLIKTLLTQYQDGNEVGLVKDSNNANKYYFKGTNEEVANNFLWYGGHQWRVIEFDTDAKTLTLITQQPLTAISLASTAWTTEEEYSSSYINQWLNDYFLNSLESNIQNNIIENFYEVGSDASSNDMVTHKKVGLLEEWKYSRTVVENIDISYLNIYDDWWLGNTKLPNSIKNVSNSGAISSKSVASGIGVRPVIKISDIYIDEGNGTLKNSFRYISYKKLLKELQVGEYVDIVYTGNDNACGSDSLCRFRVVENNNDNIKLVLNGLLNVASPFGTSTSISLQMSIYEVLKVFENGLNSNYFYVDNCYFNVGAYKLGANFNSVLTETWKYYIGLPTVGEMFSGNDIDLGNTNLNYFVDVESIENNGASNSYWTMTKYNEIKEWRIGSGGNLYNNDASNVRGVRPVIFLKNNLEIAGGEGTAQNPYTIG